MPESNNIFLIGPMGTGKTAVGRQLAKKLSKKFYDSDHEIEKHTGANISLIFELEGEEGFRKRESQIISELVSQKNIVLSTGGGSILDPENRKLLIDNGTIIYLKSTAEKLYKRTADNKYRPLLETDNRLNKIKGILNEREPYYISMANEIVDTHNQNIKQITHKILNLLKINENNRG